MSQLSHTRTGGTPPFASASRAATWPEDSAADRGRLRMRTVRREAAWAGLDAPKNGGNSGFLMGKTEILIGKVVILIGKCGFLIRKVDF
jgi:hypothetical protein